MLLSHAVISGQETAHAVVAGQSFTASRMLFGRGPGRLVSLVDMSMAIRFGVGDQAFVCVSDAWVQPVCASSRGGIRRAASTASAAAACTGSTLCFGTVEAELPNAFGGDGKAVDGTIRTGRLQRSERPLELETLLGTPELPGHMCRGLKKAAGFQPTHVGRQFTDGAGPLPRTVTESQSSERNDTVPPRPDHDNPVAKLRLVVGPPEAIVTKGDAPDHHSA